MRLVTSGFCPSRHFVAMQNSVAIGAFRTSGKPTMEYAPNKVQR